jgi:TnpA family transposase
MLMLRPCKPSSPSGTIFRQIIDDNWDDILRFIATIKLKETTASEIFRRLNSYSKQHALYRALKTFSKIIKSIFILRYIDDLELRQAIEKQLNKIENSHQFSRAVSIGNPREFTQAEKQEQEVAEGCKRLIKNAITCWNYLYLSQKISEVTGPEARKILFQAITNGSVVSWQHINLLANTIFRTKSSRIRSGSSPQN